MRKLSGEPGKEGGRQLPVFDKEWRRGFDEGHGKRIAWWVKENEMAEKEREREKVNSVDKADG